MATVLLLTEYTLIFASVLMLVALGGCYSEHSGVINIGLEGIMVMGALGGALVMVLFPNLPGPLMILAVMVGSMLFGVLYSTLLGFSAIHLKADQTIIGTAMNMLGVALATIIVKSMNMAQNASNPTSTLQYIQQKKAFIVKLGSFQFNWFMLIAIIILVIAYIVMYKTRFGLRLQACGEYPQAAASVGIDVYKMRWSGVLISGLLGGLGGIVYIMAGVSEWKFENGVAGFGFLAMAVMIFGQYRPLRIGVSALIFGFFRALGNVYTGFGFLVALNIPSTFYNMLPYIVCLVVLTFTSKNSRAPKADGIPYEKGQR